jgi:hypothetical protein
MSQGKSRSFAAVRRFDMQAHRRRFTPEFMPFVAAVLLSGTSLLAESDSVELGGIQEIVVRDATDHVSDEVGAVQIYRNGDPLGAAFVAESNDTGDESRTVVYSVGKAAGYSRDLRLVGFHGHVTNAAGSGYGVLGSFGGYVDVDDTGINDAQAWGALGGEVGANTYAVISNGDQYSTTGALWTLADSSLQQEVESIDGALGIVRNLRPSAFRFRSEARDRGLFVPESQRYGFVAEDLKVHLPSLVREGKLPTAVEGGEQRLEGLNEGSTYTSIEILGLIPILTRALQEVDSKYERALADVTRENEALRMRLAELEKELERRPQRFASSLPGGARLDAEPGTVSGSVASRHSGGERTTTSGHEGDASARSSVR